MDKLIIDRIEGDVVVCENSDGSITEIALIDLPTGAQEGSVLLFDGEKYVLDEDEMKSRENRIKAKMDALFTD